MRTLFAMSLVALLTLTTACSKNDTVSVPIDPVLAFTFSGKWVFNSSVGLNLSNDAVRSSLFADTIILSGDTHYIFINAKDTIDQGGYFPGSGEALNGFGKMQAYDSIRYKSISLVADPVYPQTVFFKFYKDTLSFSTLYFKDRSQSKTWVNYVRAK